MLKMALFTATFVRTLGYQLLGQGSNNEYAVIMSAEQILFRFFQRSSIKLISMACLYYHDDGREAKRARRWDFHRPCSFLCSAGRKRSNSVQCHIAPSHLGLSDRSIYRFNAPLAPNSRVKMGALNFIYSFGITIGLLKRNRSGATTSVTYHQMRWLRWKFLPALFESPLCQYYIAMHTLNGETSVSKLVKQQMMTFFISFHVTQPTQSPIANGPSGRSGPTAACPAAPEAASPERGRSSSGRLWAAGNAKEMPSKTFDVAPIRAMTF